MRIVRATGVTPTPWRNGGGTTREIVSSDGWRLSIATITGDGPFSRFDGLDRHFVLVSPTTLVLDVDGTPHELGFAEDLRFPGEAATTARDVRGTGTAVNLMGVRGLVHAEARVVRRHGTAELDATAVLLVSGRAGIGRDDLAVLDTAVLDGNAVTGAFADAVTVEVRVRTVRAGAGRVQPVP